MGIVCSLARFDNYHWKTWMFPAQWREFHKMGMKRLVHVVRMEGWYWQMKGWEDEWKDCRNMIVGHRTVEENERERRHFLAKWCVFLVKRNGFHRMIWLGYVARLTVDRLGRGKLTWTRKRELQRHICGMANKIWKT